ncbi:MFS transporter [Halostella sp. JP-L12]|uniref:MFS transporter n=1 Tax=Halostella TaxID=1843185 RepID=UPI000EF7902B|nr:MULTISPECIES: MFS transporter [Halostella]NHN46013.1 MFS transporter [Halostella sp. JP-L12]
MRSLLRNGNFARLFAGRLVTNAGDSVYFVAAMWLVYDLTDDPLYSGIAGFLTMGPAALQFLFGPLVDRWDLRRVLVGTQAAQGVLVLVVPLAAALDALSVWLVLAVMPVLSLLNQFVYPAQAAALPRILDDDELVRANSAFSLAYQGADAVFNAVGGVLVALAGAVTLFLADVVTFAVAAALFATLSMPPVDDGTSDGGTTDEGVAATENGDTAVADGGEGPAGDESAYLADLREGVAVLRGSVLAFVVAGAAFVNFAAGATFATLPAFADTVGGAGAYGVLAAAFAAGNFVGALVASALEDYPFGRLSVACFAVSGALWSGAVAAGPFPVTAALFGLAFVPVGVVNVLLAALVQAGVPDGLVGRVSSVLGSASMVATPVGALVGGALAGVVGPAPVVGAGGAFMAALAAYWVAVPSLRRLPAVDEVSIDPGATA